MNLRAGIFGAGFIGGVHGRSIAKTEGIELVAIADPATDVAKGLIAKEGWKANVHASFADMMAKEKLDCVYFCVPPFVHNGEVEEAAAKGLHVFLEKPIALTSARAAQMVKAVEAAGVVSQVGFHMRFLKSVEKFKALIESGQAGAPTLFDGRYWVNMDGGAWWRDVTKSGGQLHEQVIHLYDLATHLFGEVVSASGTLANLTRQGRSDYTIEDTSLGALRFANGALAAITGSNAAIPVHFIGDFRAVCQNAVVDYSSTGQAWVTPDRATFRMGDKTETVIEDQDPYLGETRDFVEAIRKGRPARTPARDGLKAIELVERIKASSR